MNDGSDSLGKSNFRESSPASSNPQEVSTETEAVQYFRNKMIKKGEQWMAIASLAGHLSQAPPEIRECVGPQNEFKQWIMRHPLIFDLRGDMVGLKDNVTYSAFNPNAEPFPEDSALSSRFNSDKEQLLLLQSTPKLKKRPKSLEMLEPRSPLMSPRSPAIRSAASPNVSAKSTPTEMTANQYKAVMFIKGIIEKKGDMKLSSLTGHFSQAPESLRNTIGWTKQDLEKFLQSHGNIFSVVEDETMSVIKQNARLNVFMTGSRPQASMKPTVTGRIGHIYHITKHRGIIGLGRNEHVFY